MLSALWQQKTNLNGVEGVFQKHPIILIQLLNHLKGLEHQLSEKSSGVGQGKY
jgi:hypothetical protein